MATGVVVIRRRWWAHLVVLFPLAVLPVICVVMAMASYWIIAEAGGWWKAPFLLAGSAVMGFAFAILLNALLTYRVELMQAASG